MDRLNGGYALLDLTKYDFSSDIDSENVLGDANELTEDEYNKIVNTIRTSYKNSKPLFVKANLYDSNHVLLPMTFRDKGATIIAHYNDVEDFKDSYLMIISHNNKYYIYCSTNHFYE